VDKEDREVSVLLYVGKTLHRFVRAVTIATLVRNEKLLVVAIQVPELKRGLVLKSIENKWRKKNQDDINITTNSIDSLVEI